MSRTTSVTLAEPLSQFVNQMVESGRLWFDQRGHQCRIKNIGSTRTVIQLRALIDEGLESGVSEETVQSIISKAKAKRNV